MNKKPPLPRYVVFQGKRQIGGFLSICSRGELGDKKKKGRSEGRFPVYRSFIRNGDRASGEPDSGKNHDQNSRGV